MPNIKNSKRSPGRPKRSPGRPKRSPGRPKRSPGRPKRSPVKKRSPGGFLNRFGIIKESISDRFKSKEGLYDIPNIHNFKGEELDKFRNEVKQKLINRISNYFKKMNRPIKVIEYEKIFQSNESFREKVLKAKKQIMEEYKRTDSPVASSKLKLSRESSSTRSPSNLSSDEDINIPEETVDTQYTNDRKQAGRCRSQVPFLCGKNTNIYKGNPGLIDVGICRRREEDCNFRNLKETSASYFKYERPDYDYSVAKGDKKKKFEDAKRKQEEKNIASTGSESSSSGRISGSRFTGGSSGSRFTGGSSGSSFSERILRSPGRDLRSSDEPCFELIEVFKKENPDLTSNLNGLNKNMADELLNCATKVTRLDQKQIVKIYIDRILDSSITVDSKIRNIKCFIKDKVNNNNISDFVKSMKFNNELKDRLKSIGFTVDNETESSPERSLRSRARSLSPERSLRSSSRSRSPERSLGSLDPGIPVVQNLGDFDPYPHEETASSSSDIRSEDFLTREKLFQEIFNIFEKGIQKARFIDEDLKKDFIAILKVSINEIFDEGEEIKVLKPRTRTRKPRTRKPEDNDMSFKKFRQDVLEVSTYFILDNKEINAGQKLSLLLLVVPKLFDPVNSIVLDTINKFLLTLKNKPRIVSLKENVYLGRTYKNLAIKKFQGSEDEKKRFLDAIDSRLRTPS